MPNPLIVQASNWKLPKRGNVASLDRRTPPFHATATVHADMLVTEPANSPINKEIDAVLYNKTPKNYRPSYLQHSGVTPRQHRNGAVAPPAVTITVNAAGKAAVNAVQSLTLSGATGGTFTVTFGSQTTIATAYNAPASTLQTNLRALSSIGAGNINVTGNAGGPYTLTFVGALAGAPQATVTANGGSLTGTTPSITPASVTTGAAAVNASQTITVSAGGIGNFRLAVLNGFTTPISTGASVAEVRSALETVVGVGHGNVTVTGNPGSWTVTFSGLLAATAVGSLVPVRD